MGFENKNVRDDSVAFIGRIQTAGAIILIVLGIVLVAIVDNDNYSTDARMGSGMLFGLLVVQAIIIFISGTLEMQYPFKGCWNLCMVASGLMAFSDILLILSKYGLATVCLILGYVLGIFGIGIGKSICSDDEPNK